MSPGRPPAARPATGTPAGDGRLRTLAVATTATVLAVVPPVLLGSLGLLVGRDLGVDEAGLGALVAVFFSATALTSVAGGRLCERLGPAASLRLAAAASAACLLGASSAGGWSGLAGWLVLGGVANGVAQPASNLLIARAGPALPRGLAYGTRQAAVPAAALLAGAAVPTVGLTWGWRPALACAAVLALAVLVLVPGGPSPAAPTPVERTRPALPLRDLVLLAAAACLGTSAALSVTTFAVGYAATREPAVPAATAGLLLVVASLTSITVRLGAGWGADRTRRPVLGPAAGMMLLGAAALATLAWGGGGTPALAVAMVVALGLGWGWPGLLVLAVVQRVPHAPAAATGVTQAGGALGGVVGPLVVGAVVVGAGWTAAWACAALAAAAAAALVAARRQPDGPQAPT